MRRWVLGVAFGLLLGPGGGAAADEGAAEVADACAARIVAAVQSRYESVRDLSADFDQTSRSMMGGPGSISESSGHVVFAKPGKMRWSYRTPVPSEVISDGQTLWLFDPAAQEVQRLPVEQGYLAGAGLQFLLGEGDLSAEFEVRPKACDASGESSAVLELIPRKPASYERLLLQAHGVSGEVEETTVVDLFGNQTRIAFRDLRTNQGPPPETFRFEVPAGVEVIDLVIQR